MGSVATVVVIVLALIAAGLAGQVQQPTFRVRRLEQGRGVERCHREHLTAQVSAGACHGYVVDHVRPLQRGGADRPESMQRQTKEPAKRKDKWEVAERMDDVDASQTRRERHELLVLNSLSSLG